AAFMWLLSRAVYDGSVALETQREQWDVVAALRRALKRRRGGSSTQGEKVPKDLPLGFGVVRNRARSADAGGRQRPQGEHSEAEVAWNVPSWERSNEKKSRTAAPSGVIALLVSAICLIPVQITFSYVDLGLTSERDLLLFGLVLGVLARAQVPLATLGRVREPEARSVRRRTRPVVVPTYSKDEQPSEPAGTVSSRPGDPLN
ncbi:MAG TPA: hypothetical protein VGP82_06815, partial [Ktedonobacterales bacterium]|nr:hypothetical protein [Ktedonobacterales bacterium]